MLSHPFCNETIESVLAERELGYISAEGCGAGIVFALPQIVDASGARLLTMAVSNQLACSRAILPPYCGAAEETQFKLLELLHRSSFNLPAMIEDQSS